MKEAIDDDVADTEDPLAELLGDDMPVATASGFDSISSSIKAEEKPFNAQKRERESPGSRGLEMPSKKVKVEVEEKKDGQVVVPKLSIVREKSK